MSLSSGTNPSMPFRQGSPRPNGASFPLVSGLERIRARLHFWPPSGAQIGVCLAVAVIYYWVAQLGLKFTIGGGLATPVWPPSGFALAALLIFGRRVWPGVWLGAFTMGLINLMHMKSLANASGLLVLAGAISSATGAAVAPWLGCEWVRRCVRGANPLESLPGVLALLGLGGAVCSVASSTISLSLLALLGIVPQSVFYDVWPTRWLGDAAGVIVFTPFLLAWCGRPTFKTKLRLLEATLCFGLLAAACFGVFIASAAPGKHGSPFAFVLIPFLLWPAMRFGQRGAATAVVIVAGISVWGTALGGGPFALETLNHSLLAMETFLSVVTLTAVCSAAVMAQRHFADTLVDQRTAELRTSEGRLRTIIETTPECVMVLAVDGSVIEMNPAGLGMAEADSLEQLRTTGFASLIAEENKTDFLNLMKRVADGGSGIMEYQFMGRKGTLRWLETHANPLLDADGKVTALIGVTRDITERKRSEEPLKAMQYSVERAGDSVFWINRAGAILYANDAACAGRRLTREALLELNISDFDFHCSEEGWAARFDVVKQRRFITFESNHRAKDGHVFPVEVSASYIAVGSLEFAFATVRDISERRRHERLASERNQALLALAQSTSTSLGEALQKITRLAGKLLQVERASVWLFTPDRQLLRCECLYLAKGGSFESGATLSATNYPQYFAALNNSKVTSADDAMNHPMTREFAKDYLAPLGITSMQDAALWRGGEVIGVLCAEHVGLQRQWSSEEASLSSALADQVVTAIEEYERRDAENALRESEARIRHLAAFPELNPNPVLAFGTDGSLVYHNGAAAELAQSLGESGIEAILPDHVVDIVKSCLASNQAHEGVNTTSGFRSLNWTFYPIDEIGAVHCYVSETTDRLRLEEQLRQSQKMDAIGQLAGGVAHDFNNLLTVILFNTDLMEFDPGLSTESKQLNSDINMAAKRAADLTRQLLLFSRREIMQPRYVDVNEAATNLTKLLQRIVSANVHQELRLHAHPLIVFADAGMLDQVLMNLVINARDAMPQGGQLNIETSERELGSGDVTLMQDIAPGRYACLAVSDTGAGIAPDVLPHIFEPFFTTKKAGEGTGLGLATVFGIVKQHGGAIQVQSEVGRGTTFRVYLPIAKERDQDDSVALPSQQLRGTETILVVEDEASLRARVVMVLGKHGYKVLEASNGNEAIAIWERQGGPIDLLYTDLVMPGGIGGRDLAAKLIERNPGLRVLFTSGYSSDVADRELALCPGQFFLQKPAQVATMLEKVRRCLDG